MHIPSPLPEPMPLDRAQGDITGLIIPAHGAALQEDGAEFLTRAFHAFGSLPADNAVTAFALQPCPGGSTGAKFFLNVTYAKPDPALHNALFAKFSRDFTDPRRDHPGRYEMAAEVPFMALARAADFPIRTAAPYFADYHMASGTGLVITERVGFGEGAIEPHRAKCLDFATMADPLLYYRATVTALAQLCGAHKAGCIDDSAFPFDPIAGSADPIRYDAAQLAAELAYVRAFVERCPQHFAPELREPAFLAAFCAQAEAIRANEVKIRVWLIHDPDLRALCHWNAHIDNAFFWREGTGFGREGAGLQCGFIDWGRVGQITLGSALWGALSAAHHDIWDEHLDELLALFVAEYAAAGGPSVSVAALEEHLIVHIATMGVARVLAFPEIIAFRCPTVAELTGPHDPAILGIESARNCLHVFTVFLKLWHTRGLGRRSAQVLARQ
ncbi:hypothetical protein [Novosphingobium sp. 9U]|uniref:hypothetical protein n=1 Tax=Novosphingobium sp. 9U TaxID=2653158 RepID=UPI00135754BD|nr:hypothetical protein [Novosphingobium sp. 9U]